MPLSSVYLPCIPQRFVMCALAFIGTTVGWMMYYNGYNTLQEEIKLSNSPTLTDRTNDNEQLDRCFPDEITAFTNDDSKMIPSSLQEKMMWSVWIGYAISSVISGIAADMCGPKHVWILGTLVTSVTSFVLPLSFRVGQFLGLVCIFLAGLGLGVMGSCCSVVVAYWAPENATTIYSAIIESGMLFALIIDFFLHVNVSSWGRYIFASVISGIIWIVLWYVLFYNRPAQHPHISHHELRYINRRTIGVSHSDYRKVTCKPVVPWRQILSSPPFISLALCSFAAAWVQSVILYQMQLYITNTLFAPIAVIPGTTAAGIALVIALDSLLISGWMSDKLLSNGCTSRINNRRFFLLSSNYLSAVLFISIPLLGCATTLVSLIFFLMIHIQGMCVAPICANVVDLAPRYAGLLRGVVSAGRGLAVILTRESAMRMVKHPESYASWKWYFFMSAAIAIVLSAFYCCFGSAEIQIWNYHCFQHDPTDRTCTVRLSINRNEETEPTSTNHPGEQSISRIEQTNNSSSSK